MPSQDPGSLFRGLDQSHGLLSSLKGLIGELSPFTERQSHKKTKGADVAVATSAPLVFARRGCVLVLHAGTASDLPSITRLLDNPFVRTRSIIVQTRLSMISME